MPSPVQKLPISIIHLILISQDPDWSIRYAAVVGLQALTKIAAIEAPIRARLKEMLASDSASSVRARIQLAQIQ